MFIEGFTSLFSNPLWLIIHLVVVVALVVWIVALYQKK